jgi:hypothetical protein
MNGDQQRLTDCYFLESCNNAYCRFRHVVTKGKICNAWSTRVCKNPSCAYMHPSAKAMRAHLQSRRSASKSKSAHNSNTFVRSLTTTDSVTIKRVVTWSKGTKKERANRVNVKLNIPSCNSSNPRVKSNSHIRKNNEMADINVYSSNKRMRVMQERSSSNRRRKMMERRRIKKENNTEMKDAVVPNTTSSVDSSGNSFEESELMILFEKFHV